MERVVFNSSEPPTTSVIYCFPSRSERAKLKLSRSSCMLCQSDTRPLFSLPKEKDRMKKWLQCIEKESLLNSLPTVYVYNNGRLCHRHFEERMFTSSLKNKLTKFAKPFDIRLNPDLDEAMSEELSPSVDEELSPSVDEELSPSVDKELSPSVDEELSPSVDELSPSVDEELSLSVDEKMNTYVINPISAARNERRCVELTPKTSLIRNLRSNVSRLKKKLFKAEGAMKTQLQDKLTSRQYAFVQSLIRNGKVSANGRRWTAKEKAFALNIYMQSSSAYGILQKNLILPCEKTLRNCTVKVAKEDGFCPILFDALKKKIKELPEEQRICTLVFDEMSIKSQLRYNASLDRVDGYETADTVDNPKIATQALCFMLRGVMKNWKQVIAYYFRGNTCSQGWLQEKVLHIINKVMSCGLKVIAIVCDQGPNNQALFKSLDVSEKKPYFKVDEENIFALYDMPHLIKSVRNNLKKYDCKFKSFKYNEQRKASWEDISGFYDLDVKQKYRIAPKLTDLHMNATGLSSMKVSLATQVFSHSVAAGLCIYDKTKPNTTALQTASFVNKMDQIFDSMNSKVLYSSKTYACAVSKDSPHIKKLAKWCKWIETWEFQNAENKPMRTACKKGLIQTLMGTIGIWKALQDKLSFLLTSRLNQDCIENTFSSVRRRGGFRDNPSALEFRSAIRNIIVHNFMKRSNSKNCEDDGDFNLIDLNNKTPRALTAFYDDDEEKELAINIKRSEVPTVSVIEQNVIAYISGVLTRALLKKSPCEDCKNLLVGPKALQTHLFLIYFKEYKESLYGLNWPTDEFYIYMLELSEIYFQNIETFFKKPNIRKNLYAVLEKANFEFFDHSHKEDAKHFIIKYFINMMIRHSIKLKNRENRQITLRNKNKKRKLNHVQNI